MTDNDNNKLDKELQQLLDKMVRLNIFVITKINEKGGPEQIDFTKKFWSYLLGPGLEWVIENRMEVAAQFGNDAAILRLGMIVIVMAKYLGLDNEEQSERLGELLPIANAVIRCAEEAHFRALWM